MQTSGFSDNAYGNCEIKELEEQRYLMFRGKVPTKYFVKRLYGEEDSFVLYQLGVNPPADDSLRQDCRGAQEKYVMQLHDAHLAARMPRHS